MKMLAVVTMAAAMGFAATPIAGAHGLDSKANATFLGSIHIGGKKATLSVRYHCATGQNLWVSAKELASGATSKKLTKEGSTRWPPRGGRAIATISRATGRHTPARSRLTRSRRAARGGSSSGKAWVQFCVTTGTTEANTKLNLSKSGWVTVV